VVSPIRLQAQGAAVTDELELITKKLSEAKFSSERLPDRRDAMRTIDVLGALRSLVHFVTLAPHPSVLTPCMENCLSHVERLCGGCVDAYVAAVQAKNALGIAAAAAADKKARAGERVVLCFVCMYACMYTCVCVDECMYVSMYVCMYVWMYVFVVYLLCLCMCVVYVSSEICISAHFVQLFHFVSPLQL
jgi:hypothetical protein